MPKRKYAFKEDVDKLTEKVDAVDKRLHKFLTNDWHEFITKDWWRMKWQMWTVLSIQVTILATLIAAVVLIVLGLV